MVTKATQSLTLRLFRCLYGSSHTETRFENAIGDPKRYKELPQANIRQRVAPSGDFLL